MADFSVKGGSVQDSTKVLAEQNQDYARACSSLGDTVKSLSQMWKGPSESAFQTAFAKEYENLNNFYKGITQYIDALGKINGNYGTTEVSVKEVASKTY